MPIKLKKTPSASALYGNSVQFNGSNQYLTLSYSSALDLTSTYTIEGWLRLSSLSSTTKFIFQMSSPNGANFAIVSLSVANGNITIDTRPSVGAAYSSITSITSLTTNTWYHIAVSNNANTAKLFINGTQDVSGTIPTMAFTPSYVGIGLLNNGYAGAQGYIDGYLSNFRIVKGTALYTSSFTPPTSPLTAIANTSLLTCQSATIIDNSTNNFTITNNNGATVSSAITPFSSSLAYGGTNFKKNIYPRVGRSVQFNGSNYLTLTPNSSLAFGTNNFTVEMWIYPTSISAGSDTILIEMRTSNNGKPVYAIHLQSALGTNTGAGVAYLQTATGVITTNTWQHIAFVRNSGTTTIYVNGVSKISTSDTGAYTYDAFKIGSGLDNSYTGYISNLRIVNGTAVYTTNFTPPTSPLTAISGTSLLTCQSPTIIDNSSNNFTITNNNTAVVSTTNPFGADTTGGGMGMKKSAAVVYLTQKAIFGYGTTGAYTAVTNLVSNAGVVATDTTGVGTARLALAAAGYGTDKAIFGYGNTGAYTAITNLVSNTGVVATDTSGVGTARGNLAAVAYGSDKAIFGYGWVGSGVSITNKVSNTGVISNDTTGVGTSRGYLAGAGYGSDKAIFGYGYTGAVTSITNLVSNTGVVATDTTGVGTSREFLAAAGYGTDKAIFGYGNTSAAVSMTNLVSNTGVVATDITGVGTARYGLAAAGYGGDKAIFGYGSTGTNYSITNKVSNVGGVATDTTGVGTIRYNLAAAGFSLT